MAELAWHMVELPNQSQQNIVANLMGHPVVTILARACHRFSGEKKHFPRQMCRSKTWLQYLLRRNFSGVGRSVSASRSRLQARTRPQLDSREERGGEEHRERNDRENLEGQRSRVQTSADVWQLRDLTTYFEISFYTVSL